MEKAWLQGITGKEIIVGVVDDGELIVSVWFSTFRDFSRRGRHSDCVACVTGYSCRLVLTLICILLNCVLF